MVKSKILRVLLILLGFISLVIGAIGVVLPIIPTTPLLLLTSFCFVKSSMRFNKWFLNTKLYKKYLENFAKNKVMVISHELCLLIGVSTMLICTMYFVNKPVVSIILSILIVCKYSYFIFQVKPVSKQEFIRIREESLNNNELMGEN